MSHTAIRHLLVEACEPLLIPVTNRFELFGHACRAVGLLAYPVKAVLPAFAAADGQYAALPRPLATREDEIAFWAGYYGTVLAELGVKATPEQVRALVKRMTGQQVVEVSPELPPVIQRVRALGGRVVLVADWYASFRQTLINSGLLGLFPELFLAGQQGVYLEDQTGVLGMLRGLSLAPETVAFLGEPRAALGEIGVICYSSARLHELPFSH